MSPRTPAPSSTGDESSCQPCPPSPALLLPSEACNPGDLLLCERRVGADKARQHGRTFRGVTEASCGLCPSPRPPRKPYLGPPQAWRLQATQLARIPEPGHASLAAPKTPCPSSPVFFCGTSHPGQGAEGQGHFQVRSPPGASGLLPAEPAAVASAVLSPQLTLLACGHQGLVCLFTAVPHAQDSPSPEESHTRLQTLE